MEPGSVGGICKAASNLYWAIRALESISKIAAALDVPLSKLFENISLLAEEQDIPSRCYALVQAQSPRKQEALLELLNTVIQYEKL